MGIEISEHDRNYADFLNAFLPPEDQIHYDEHNKVVPAPHAAKTEQAASLQNGPIPNAKGAPVPPPKSLPSAKCGIDHETEADEIDSLISSLFSTSEKNKSEH